MPYQLLVTHGRSATQTLRLAEGVTTVGRHEECQLRIRSSQVSRKHCQLFEKKGLLIVKDLGSSNGTFVNGKKIEEQRVLEPGDELAIGPVRLKVAKPEAPAAAGAAAPGRKATDTAVAEAIPVGEDEVFEIELDDQEPTVAAMPTAPAPKPEAPPKPAEKDEPIELGEDAVAGFLLDLDIDEDDKK